MAVFTLVVDCGRFSDDGLPAAATGARLLCYLAAEDEAGAVDEAVRVLRSMDVGPVEVTSFGTLEERLGEGEVADEERAMMGRAAEENALVVGEVTPLFET